MGPGIGMATAGGSYTEKMPSAFDSDSCYKTFHEDVTLWLPLTTLAPAKQGVALVARLAGEAKASAKSLGTNKIFSNTGVESILSKLDKLYLIDKVDQLDIDFTTFLDYSWKAHLSVNQFIAGFHTRLDRIAEGPLTFASS